MTAQKPTLAILGGSGALGSGLARRWAKAGYPVVLGSRDATKAVEAAASFGHGITGMDNEAAAAAGEIVVLTVPFAQQGMVLGAVKPALQGKILVDVTVPLVPPKVARVQLPASGSAAQAAQTLLGEDVRVVSAFQNVAAALLQEDGPIDCDILVCGNDKAARATVLELVRDAGLRGFHGGPLANAAATEALTSVLIFINKQYDAHAGIRITGLADDVS